MVDRMKRYNLVLPMETFEQVQQVARARQATVAHVLRQFVKLGLMVEGNSDATLVIKQGGVERELVVL